MPKSTEIRLSQKGWCNKPTILQFQWLFNTEKELGRFIIQTCPTYNNEKCSRRILSEINIYCQYIILTICKHATFCWMTITFIEKKW